MRAIRSEAGIASCLLIPGYAQWRWGQRERGIALMGSFAASLLIGVFAWGTTVGLVLLAFAYATHVWSASDAIRQRSFPARSRAVAWLGTAAGLGFLLYLPLLTCALRVAWPGANGRGAAERYLVNCWAYQKSAPQRDDWVWYRSHDPGESRVGRVIAVEGQYVSWVENVLEVDRRREPAITNPFRSPMPPSEVRYRIPEGCVLIAPKAETRGDQKREEGLAIISIEQVSGRPWARMYPIRKRRLLLSGACARRPGDS